jgi:small GTP-binding protein
MSLFIFQEEYSPTVGLEFGTKELSFERCVIKAQVWDTAGQERPEKMSKAFYKDSLGAILVYDVGNVKSFNHLKSVWLPQIRRYGHENIPCIMGTSHLL